MLRIAGIDQRAAHERGDGVYAVAELSIRYRRPAKLDDDLLIRSRVIRTQAASVRIHQKVMRAEELLAEADVKAAFVSPDGRPRRQPNQWIDIFRNLTGAE
jgi:acyl-CoA thioester hydrolase